MGTSQRIEHLRWIFRRDGERCYGYRRRYKRRIIVLFEFQTAFNPQRIDRHASAIAEYFIDLIMRTSKYSYFCCSLSRDESLLRRSCAHCGWEACAYSIVWAERMMACSPRAGRFCKARWVSVQPGRSVDYEY